MTPKQSYLICATPRSGSTLLCAALTDIGVAGRPAEHFELLLETGRPRQPRDYFGRSNDPEVWALLDDPDFEGILGGPRGWYAPQPEAVVPHTVPDFAGLTRRAFELGTTPNGVFGTKIMWAYFRDFVRLARRDGRQGVAPAAIPGAVFPSLRRYVWIRRRDTTKQAVSLWKALQTWNWRHDPEVPAREVDLRYSAAAIRHLKLRLDEHNVAWKNYFVSYGLEPVEVVYEDFIQDYGAAVLDLLVAIGVPTPEGYMVQPPAMKRQADALSAAWAERFEREHLRLVQA